MSWVWDASKDLKIPLSVGKSRSQWLIRFADELVAKNGGTNVSSGTRVINHQLERKIFLNATHSRPTYFIAIHAISPLGVPTWDCL
jgi:hypothetical protein